jgi:hypothetical protein
MACKKEVVDYPSLVNAHRCAKVDFESMKLVDVNAYLKWKNEKINFFDQLTAFKL